MRTPAPMPPRTGSTTRCGPIWQALVRRGAEIVRVVVIEDDSAPAVAMLLPDGGFHDMGGYEDLLLGNDFLEHNDVLLVLEGCADASRSSSLSMCKTSGIAMRSSASCNVQEHVDSAALRLKSLSHAAQANPAGVAAGAGA